MLQASGTAASLSRLVLKSGNLPPSLALEGVIAGRYRGGSRKRRSLRQERERERDGVGEGGGWKRRRRKKRGRRRNDEEKVVMECPKFYKSRSKKLISLGNYNKPEFYLYLNSLNEKDLDIIIKFMEE